MTLGRAWAAYVVQHGVTRDAKSSHRSYACMYRPRMLASVRNKRHLVIHFFRINDSESRKMSAAFPPSPKHPRRDIVKEADLLSGTMVKSFIVPIPPSEMARAVIFCLHSLRQ